jgi:hypothetical protein
MRISIAQTYPFSYLSEWTKLFITFSNSILFTGLTRLLGVKTLKKCQTPKNRNLCVTLLIHSKKKSQPCCQDRLFLKYF